MRKTFLAGHRINPACQFPLAFCLTTFASFVGSDLGLSHLRCCQGHTVCATLVSTKHDTNASILGSENFKHSRVLSCDPGVCVCVFLCVRARMSASVSLCLGL